ncbi:egg cell-secreted protein 1.2-like [Telopea speciosissima]|uniref:egg cell-secreted protein 1.2-like n=1 Tax=Telopea speciosissima TaxID=54955 RepID=UPI001CC47B74|nr:egg cell-secreted protein 1.2-like [Telopea speciosissima]
MVLDKLQDLAPRLENGGGGGSMVECWNALLELQSCNNEIILFFLNGEAYLGFNCCRVITHQCWPSMHTYLGFTAEEDNILYGY